MDKETIKLIEQNSLMDELVWQHLGSKLGKRYYDVLHKHYSSLVTVVDVHDRGTVIEEVSREDLLSGEISAVTFAIGPYLVRSAQRLYKVYRPKYDPSKEEPGDDLDVECVRNMVGIISFLTGAFGRDIRITHEISAMYNGDPKGAFNGGFKYICRATSATNHYWHEMIECICSVKAAPLQPDNDACLFVLNGFTGDSFSVDNWYKLDPSGEITMLILHPFDSDIDNAHFK